MFKERCHRKELLDGDNIPAADLEQNLRELHTINHWLGGYAASLSGLRKVLVPKKQSVVVDIGSGGGDTALLIRNWSLRNNYNVQIRGIDINPVCVDYSRRRADGVPGVQFICDDYRKVRYYVPDVDVLHASLFCHHLSDGDILELLRFSKNNNIALVINDLMRHPFAYYSISLLTRYLSRSRLVKNDAPLSVLRGFSTAEWHDLIQRAGIERYSITSKWAFRHEVIIYNERS
jgi:SAM-dependent methyltransferase